MMNISITKPETFNLFASNFKIKKKRIPCLLLQNEKFHNYLDKLSQRGDLACGVKLLRRARNSTGRFSPSGRLPDTDGIVETFVGAFVSHTDCVIDGVDKEVIQS